MASASSRARAVNVGFRLAARSCEYPLRQKQKPSQVVFVLKNPQAVPVFRVSCHFVLPTATLPARLAMRFCVSSGAFRILLMLRRRPAIC